MNYKFETIMTWITYMKNGIWNVDKRNDYADDPEVIRSKFEDLFENELYREFNDSRHIMPGLYNQVGTVAVFINPETCEFNVNDNYNNLLAFYNGIYKEFEGKRLCLKTKKHGINKTFDIENGYFEFREKEDDDHIFVKSIVEGTCKVKAPNVRRMISILFARQFNYLESTNPETFMFMDYEQEEKDEIIKDCEQYDKRINKKKATKKVSNEEEKWGTRYGRKFSSYAYNPLWPNNC